MTGPELKQLRADLGEALGRRLSVADMARLCGLAPGNGADTMRKWEDGAGPSGPVAALLSVLAYALPDQKIPQDLFEDQKLLDGRPLLVGAEVIAPVIRAAMRAEIRRRLS